LKRRCGTTDQDAAVASAVAAVGILTKELNGLLESFNHVPAIAGEDDVFVALAEVSERLVRDTLEVARTGIDEFDARDALTVGSTRLAGLTSLFTTIQRLADDSPAQWARSCVARVTSLLQSIGTGVVGLPVSATRFGEIPPAAVTRNWASQTGFKYEWQLRDFLASNMPTLPGHSRPLSLYRAEGRDGVEFRTAVGRIDILAVSNDSFYVLELKLGLATDAALGQLLRYMGWVRMHLAKGKTVFGVVIAAAISPKLSYAASNLANIHLMEYRMAFSLERAST
jgi:hypothetical protein